MAAAYNAGPHRVKSWLASFGHLEMDEFIEHIRLRDSKLREKITKNYVIYRQLYEQNTSPLAWLNKSIEVPKGTSLTVREPGKIANFRPSAAQCFAASALS